MRYRIKQVDAVLAPALEVLAFLHHQTFSSNVIFPSPHQGYWWIAYYQPGLGLAPYPAAFAHLCPSTYYPGEGYFARVGVLRGHRGHGLQCCLMRKAEEAARGERWFGIVSDTTRRPYSAANFERLGYHQFMPEKPWGEAQTIYWRKDL